MSMAPEDARKIETWIEVCSDEMEKLSEWEATFIESIADQFSTTGFLSRKQVEILRKIYDKVV